MNGQLVPDTAALGRWIFSWVQPSGAVHGFHNHSIWGSNPYRCLDFTSGHTTFAGPLILGLINILKTRPDDRGKALLLRLVEFQAGSLQPDGQYDHIGFQVGDTLRLGLIHNAVPNVALAYALRHASGLLGPELCGRVAARVRESLSVLDQLYPNEKPGSGTCNQEYARTWARLLYADATGDAAARGRAQREIRQFIADFHRQGYPDAACAGVLREANNPNYLEPAEYYGLIIPPLILAARMFGDPGLLDAALALGRHIVRSSWKDARGQARLHRSWQAVGGRTIKTTEPMCISGSGLTLWGLHSLQALAPDPGFTPFLDSFARTYGNYQHPAGFFVAGSGWHSELDIAPCTAWEAHDFAYLAAASPPAPDFWDRFFSPAPSRLAVMLGDSCTYLESGVHWAIDDYFTTDTFQLRGRKDRTWFGRDHPKWIPNARHLPEEMAFPDRPVFIRTPSGIELVRGDPAGMDVMLATGEAWRP